jgi:hypothetical protein
MIGRGMEQERFESGILTALEHALHELCPGEDSVAVLILAPEEVRDAELLGPDPLDVALTPHVEIKILEALQLETRRMGSIYKQHCDHGQYNYVVCSII